MAEALVLLALDLLSCFFVTPMLIPTANATTATVASAPRMSLLRVVLDASGVVSWEVMMNEDVMSDGPTLFG